MREALKQKVVNFGDWLNRGDGAELFKNRNYATHSNDILVNILVGSDKCWRMFKV